MGDEKTKDANQVYVTINSPEFTDKELVPLSDIEKILAAGLYLYSWGGNGITFLKEDYIAEILLEAEEEGYQVRLQYACREEPNRRGYYNLTKCEAFFKKEGIKTNDLDEGGQIHTQPMTLDDAIKLYTKIETNRKVLLW